MLRATWELSASLALALFAAYGLLRLVGVAGRPRVTTLASFFVQFGVVVAIFAVYQRTSLHRLDLTAGAEQRALWVWDVEQRLRMGSELAIQRWVLPFPTLVRGLNAYYAGLHLTSMTAFLVWMWWRHRAHYLLACVTVAGTTLISVLLHNVSVAPPRLLSELGFVDTGLLYGQSVYGPAGTGISSQLAAMPSLHVAWAGIIAGFALVVSASRWRWLLVGHFAMTCFVVVATANHWWLDGVAGLLIAWGVYAVARLLLPSPGALTGTRADIDADAAAAVPAP
ncbi:MAG: phosphatase PAP2 family protein [Candidatus Nanopelagicales bacterium]